MGGSGAAGAVDPELWRLLDGDRSRVCGIRHIRGDQGCGEEMMYQNKESAGQLRTHKYTHQTPIIHIVEMEQYGDNHNMAGSNANWGGPRPASSGISAIGF